MNPKLAKRQSKVMPSLKTRLPRASTLAYKELRREHPAVDQPQKDVEEQNESPNDHIANDANKAIIAALEGLENHPNASDLSEVSLQSEKIDNLRYVSQR